MQSTGLRLQTTRGETKSERCKENLRVAASKTWDVRGRKPERDKSQNKTHKVNSLDEAELRRLYVDEGLSDAKIGVMFDMTGEGVGYRRKKWNIPTRKRHGMTKAEYLKPYDGALLVAGVMSEAVAKRCSENPRRRAGGV